MDFKQSLDYQNSFDFPLNLASKTHFFHKAESLVKSSEKIFDSFDLPFAINSLIYGQKKQKILNRGFYRSCVFYINESNIRYLIWIGSKHNSLDLLRIRLIHDIKSFDFKKTKEINEFLYINYSDSKGKKQKITIKFPCFRNKKIFWQGILHFMRETRLLYHERSFIDGLASHFMTEEKTMKFIDLKAFLKRRGIFIEENELEKIFKRLNFKGKGPDFQLNREMLKSLLREMLTYNEILEVFEKYCGSWFEIENNSQKDCFLILEELKDFFIQEQKQVLTDENLRKIIEKYEEKGKTEEISIKGLRNMLFSKNNQIFDLRRKELFQDMNRPLTEYYIKSSHNTYLNSNQIIGFSSVEAYIKALSNGYRCIELDCWDGEKGEPVIYHGYTLTTKIRFSNVLQAIKDYAFIKNHFPIILSLENHCNKTQQLKMSEIILKICGNSLYLLPENHGNFNSFPSPQNLLNKILLKAKIPFLRPENRKESSFLRSFKQTSEKNHISRSVPLNIKENLDKSPENRDFYDNFIIDFAENCEIKNHNISLAENMGILGLNFLEKNQVKSIAKIKEKLNNPIIKPVLLKNISETMNESEKSHEHGVFLNNPNNSVHDSVKIFKIHSENVLSRMKYEDSKKIEEKEEKTNFSDVFLSYMQKEKKSEAISNVFSKSTENTENLSIDFSKINENFKNCISLIGSKPPGLTNNANRSVFTVFSIKETQFLKLWSENEENLRRFHQKFLTRIYPSGTRIDSSNYDPIPAFLSGSQMIAMNIQTNDLGLLIYESLFMENGGNNSGYVLKPKSLRFDENGNKIEKKPRILEIRAISGQKIMGKLKNQQKSFYLEVSLRGNKLDEKENKSFRSEIIKKNELCVMFNLKCEFTVNFPAICFVIFQIFEKNDMTSDKRVSWYCVPFKCIRQGYRIVPLFNNGLEEIENSVIFAHIKLM